MGRPAESASPTGVAACSPSTFTTWAPSSGPPSMRSASRVAAITRSDPSRTIAELARVARALVSSADGSWVSSAVSLDARAVPRVKHGLSRAKQTHCLRAPRASCARPHGASIAEGEIVDRRSMWSKPLERGERVKAALLSSWFFVTVATFWLLKPVRIATLLAHLGARETPYVQARGGRHRRGRRRGVLVDRQPHHARAARAHRERCVRARARRVLARVARLRPRDRTRSVRSSGRSTSSSSSTRC